jgi:L-iditol 2-dehydrogenase
MMKALVKYASGEGNVDITDGERLQAALRCGAAAAINIGEQKLSNAVQDYTDGKGVDVAFECAGHPGSARGCLEALRPMGRYTQIAICGQDIQFPIDQIFYKQLTMSGSICYTVNLGAHDEDLC